MKKILSFFMSAIMLATLLMPSAFAETTWETFENEDGTLTVTGYNGPGGDVTIPAQIDGKTVGLIASEILVGMSESVTSFSAEPGSAFYTAENGVLYSVPDPAYPDWKFVAAYPKASAAEEFYIPDYVWQFDPRVCAGADALKKVSFPQGIASIASEAFADCKNLTEIEFRGEYSLPHGTYIDEEGFYHDDTGSYISGGLLIGDGAFRGCSSLKAVTLPQGTSVIAENAFRDCSSLEAVLIPDSVEYFTDNPQGAGIFDGSPLVTVYGLADSKAQEFCTLIGLPFQTVSSYEEGKSLVENHSSQTASPSETPSEWAIPEVNAARANGLIPAELDSSYTSPITRREFCLLVCAYADKMGLSSSGSPVSFSDTSDASIQRAAALGVIQGYPDGTFAPDNSILRSEAAAMLARTAALTGNTANAPYEPFSDETQFGWAQENIEFISSCIDTRTVTAIMGGVGDNLFDPNGNYTREQAILTFQRLYRYCTGVIQPLYPGNVPVEINGGVMVSLEGGQLRFSNLQDGEYSIIVGVGLNYHSYTEMTKSDIVTAVNSEITYDISDIPNGRYTAVIRPYTSDSLAAAYTEMPELPQDGRILSAAPATVEPPYVDIIKDNDHGYLIPYPAYEHNKKMFQETQAPAAGEYLNATQDIQADNAEIRALAESITAGLSSDYEKASAIYDWMGQNIAYDYETYHAVDDESQRPQDAVSVMNQRSAVCAGYSQLAAALLRSIGIPTKYVLGFPSLDYGIGETTDDWIKILMNGGDEENGIYLVVRHAWNEVWVGDRWVIMDTTWGRMQNEENWDDFRTQRDYFDPSLWKFSYSHIILEYPDET